MTPSSLQIGLMVGAVLTVALAGGFALLAYVGGHQQRARGTLQRRAAMERELFAAANLPYTAHVDECVVKTKAGDYVQALRLQGSSFECADDEQINNWHERLNILWRNLASDQLSLWTHVVRRRDHVYPPGECPLGFSRELEERYRQRVAAETLMVNEIYLALVYRPQVGLVSSAAAKLFTKASVANAQQERHDALEACSKLRAQLLAALERYEPEVLGIYDRNGRRFSALLEYFALLVNGEWRPVPLPRAPIDEVLMTTRPFFGAESLEYRSAAHTRIGAFLGIKEYPTPTQPGMYNLLLRADFPFVLTQSFTFLPKSTAQGLLARQYNRMANVQDLAQSQAEDLREGLDALTSNQFVMADHHFSLQVLADAFDGAKEAEGRPRLKQLLDHVAAARNLLAETGMVVAREDLALEAAFWAQLPGNFAFRPRKAPLTSRNFAAMAPFHNFPTGRATGNHWGDALTLLITSARSPYYLSLQASDPREPEGGSRKDVGHTSLIGLVGSGKTVLIGFLLCMLRKSGATQVVFDKDQGLHILIAAEGGRYCTLRNGQPTGMNPLQLQPTPANTEFLKAWLRRLLQRRDRTLSVQEETQLDQALHGVLGLPRPARRLSRLLEFLDPTDPEGLYARLARWCDITQGDYAWVFDNRDDAVVALLEGAPLIGFDVTDFLNNDVTRAPTTMYLFHIVSLLLDGRRLVVWMDEFSKLLADPAFADFAQNGLQTWRKLEGVLVFATQSTSNVLGSPIARTLVEQTATKIFFPNPDATAADYIDGFSLSEEEFRLLKEGLEPGSRMFLLKQGHQSVVCELDLKGFDYELNVISGRRGNVELMQRLIAEVGSDPAHWLPRFKQEAGQGGPARASTSETQQVAVV